METSNGKASDNGSRSPGTLEDFAVEQLRSQCYRESTSSDGSGEVPGTHDALRARDYQDLAVAVDGDPLPNRKGQPCALRPFWEYI